MLKGLGTTRSILSVGTGIITLASLVEESIVVVAVAGWRARPSSFSGMVADLGRLLLSQSLYPVLHFATPIEGPPTDQDMARTVASPCPLIQSRFWSPNQVGNLGPSHPLLHLWCLLSGDNTDVIRNTVREGLRVVKTADNVPSMGTRRGHEAGPTAQRVRTNLAELRERRGVSLRTLSKRLERLGHPLLASGLSKIETGARRADVDDLTALAIALDVSPNRLLLPGTAGKKKVELTSEAEATEVTAWRWATGEAALPNDLWTDTPGGIDLDRAKEFRKENRPHDRETGIEDLQEHRDALFPAIRACEEAIEKTGLSRQRFLESIRLVLEIHEFFWAFESDTAQTITPVKKKRRADGKGGSSGKH